MDVDGRVWIEERGCGGQGKECGWGKARKAGSVDEGEWWVCGGRGREC